MTRKILALMTSALLCVGLSALPASAATKAQQDPVNARVPSSFDLRRLVYDNGGQQLVIKINVRNLRDTDTFVRTEFSTRAVRASGQVLVISAFRNRGGDGGGVYLTSENRRGQSTSIPCNNLGRSFNLETDRITLRVPQFCLGEATGTQRLRTIIGTVHRTFDLSEPISVRRR